MVRSTTSSSSPCGRKIRLCNPALKEAAHVSVWAFPIFPGKWRIDMYTPSQREPRVNHWHFCCSAAGLRLSALVTQHIGHITKPRCSISVIKIVDFSNSAYNLFPTIQIVKIPSIKGIIHPAESCCRCELCTLLFQWRSNYRGSLISCFAASSI